MALKTAARKQWNAVELVPAADDAVADGADYEAYIKSGGDEGKLTLVDGLVPTRLLCNFEFDSKSLESLKNAVTRGVDDDGSPSISLGSMQMRLAKLALKDIRNPPDADGCLSFKKDSRGLAHDDVIAELEKHGAVANMWMFYTANVQNPRRASAKNS